MDFSVSGQENVKLPEYIESKFFREICYFQAPYLEFDVKLYDSFYSWSLVRSGPGRQKYNNFQ